MKSAVKAEVQVDGIDEYGESYETPWEGTNTVQAGYYGLVDPERVAWAVEFAGTTAEAKRIVRNQASIDAIVEAHGGRARLWVKFDGNAMTVTEYDGRRWTETVAAK